MIKQVVTNNDVFDRGPRGSARLVPGSNTNGAAPSWAVQKNIAIDHQTDRQLHLIERLALAVPLPSHTLVESIPANLNICDHLAVPARLTGNGRRVGAGGIGPPGSESNLQSINGSYFPCSPIR